MDAAAGKAGRGGSGRAARRRYGSIADDGAEAGDSAEPGPAAGWGSAQGRATTTLLLRHGQTAPSTERPFAGRGGLPPPQLRPHPAADAAGPPGAPGGGRVV